MASESTEEQTVSLPTELDDWLDEHAATLDVDKEALLVQLLSAYRTTVELDGDIGEELTHDIFERDVVEDRVDERVKEALDEQLQTALRERLDEQLDTRIEEALAAVLDDTIDERIDAALDDELSEQINQSTNSVQRRLEDQIQGIQSDFDSKITDVRERVIQVKKETDTKAPKDHTHEQLDAVASLSGDLTDIGRKLEQLREEYNETIPEQNDRIEDIDGRLENVEERLKTVAWVVSDLRNAVESDGGLEAVDRIKRAAAKADIQRAKCENCGNGVTLSLLTDPECPHCEATVTNIEPAGGWFSDPKLLVASQLEAGEQS